MEVFSIPLRRDSSTRVSDTSAKIQDERTKKGTGQKRARLKTSSQKPGHLRHQAPTSAIHNCCLQA